MDTGSDDELRWWVNCVDFSGRTRRISVLVMGDRVAVVTPPGETAVLSASDAAQLALALDKAASGERNATGSLPTPRPGPTEGD